MKNKRENYCTFISMKPSYRCDANPRYKCQYFERDVIFMSECAYYAKGFCLCTQAQVQDLDIDFEISKDPSSIGGDK